MQPLPVVANLFLLWDADEYAYDDGDNLQVNHTEAFMYALSRTLKIMVNEAQQLHLVDIIHALRALKMTPTIVQPWAVLSPFLRLTDMQSPWCSLTAFQWNGSGGNTLKNSFPT